MFKTIKTSQDNKQVISDLTQKLALGAENVIARLAFAYSLAHHGQLDLKDSRDSQGKEYSANVLFGNHLPFYIAMICQRYQIYKSHKDLSRYVKLHIDQGLEDMFEQTNKKGLDFVIEEIGNGYLQ